ncbi:radical SAM protein [Myxococcota bacterium]|nr:radical SAM protein [Myxococcota bacterium]MBU1534925.1 radical SAM protein [Myxococcota bacterium]
MKTYLHFLNEISNRAAVEHGKYQSAVNWVNPYLALEYEEKRDAFISRTGSGMNWAFKNTKPWVNSLSRGCELCGAGEWSCLFVTGICNAHCFYCPARQDLEELPQTQRLIFSDPGDYARYINRFGFSGVALSGGEPLMVMERTLAYIEALRRDCDPALYMWLYTNGILADQEKFRSLARAGLNEIRFDLGAVNYKPEVCKEASRWIEHVTVEIPAVPEDVPTLKAILPTLCSNGVTNLNLHQLRLTAYNAPKLLARNYTYLHGEQPTVLESELAAYEIMEFVIREKLPIGVNYCNFQYKNRFQKAGFRRKMATQLAYAGEVITQNGFLLTMMAETDGVQTAILQKELESLLSLPDRLILTYRGRVIENMELQGDETPYLIDLQRYRIKEGMTMEPLVIERELLGEFLAMMLDMGHHIPEDATLFSVWQQEFIEEGMRSYF